MEKGTISKQKDSKNHFWEQYNLDKKFLLFYTQNHMNAEEFFSRIKKGIIISILSCIILIWGILCNTLLNDIASSILFFSLAIVAICVVGIIIVARKNDFVTIQDIEPEEIYHSMEESRFPSGYNPKEYNFIKFCMNFIQVDEDSIIKDLAKKYGDKKESENVTIGKHETKKDEHVTTNKQEIEENEYIITDKQEVNKSENIVANKQGVNDDKIVIIIDDQEINEKKDKTENDIKTEKVEIIDDFQKIGFLITNYFHFKSINMPVMSLEEFNKLMSEPKFSAIDFEKLEKDSNDIYKLTTQQEKEQNLIIQQLCVPLKRAGYLDSANKVYKYIYKTYGFSQVLMNSWAKVFVCNKQFDIAYKLFELGDNQYRYRLKIGDLKPDPVTTMILGGILPSQCYENMKKTEKAMSDKQYADQLVREMGGNPNINNANKLE